jgi:hypothetical protein
MYPMTRILINSKLNWRKSLSKAVNYILSSRRATIISYNDKYRRDIFDSINQIGKETDLLLCPSEGYTIFMAVKATEKIKGDLAEVGVYKGGSSKIICEAKGLRTLHLFDTFEGIPEVGSIDSKQFFAGQYVGIFNEVKEYLKNYENVYFYKGVFPTTADPIKDKNFSFVHLDVDTYLSTKECLNFFYERMSKGGIMIIHDYNGAEGVRRAVQEFFADKPEYIIEIANSQCMILKF